MEKPIASLNMDSAGQLPVFFSCLLLGLIGGAAYEIFEVFPCIFGKRSRNVFDVLFFLAYALFVIFAADNLRFPSFRLYFYAGIACGWGIYLKSFHILLAFFKKVCYNMSVKRNGARKNQKGKEVKTRK